MKIRGVGPRPNRTIPDRSISLLTSTHSLLLETQTRMSYPRLSCGSCDLSLASAKWTHYSRRISWGLHHGAGHSTEFATDPPFPWDLYENGIAIRTWPCVWPVQEGLSGLSWVRLAWSRQTTILAVASIRRQQIRQRHLAATHRASRIFEQYSPSSSKYCRLPF
jgi:hypothetical protein